MQKQALIHCTLCIIFHFGILLAGRSNPIFHRAIVNLNPVRRPPHLAELPNSMRCQVKEEKMIRVGGTRALAHFITIEIETMQCWEVSMSKNIVPSNSSVYHRIFPFK